MPGKTARPPQAFSPATWPCLFAVVPSGRKMGLPVSRCARLHAVAGGVDVGDVGAHHLVGHDAAGLAHGDAGFAGDGRIGPGAGGYQHHVRFDVAAVRRYPFDRRIGVGFEAERQLLLEQLDAVAAQLVLDQLRDLRLAAREDAVAGLDHRHLGACRPERLRHLQADVAGADDCRPTNGPAGDELLYGSAALQGTKGKDAGEGQARNAGDDRLGAGGDDELVVVEDASLAGRRVDELDGRALGIDALRLVARAHVDVPLRPEVLRRVDDEAVLVFDDVGDEVGDAAEDE